MSEESENGNSRSSRRNFLKVGAGLGAAALASNLGAGLFSLPQEAAAETGDTVKALTTDGKVIEVDQAYISAQKEASFISRKASHTGIPNRKFVMVIDLARCKNARKCVEACQQGHHMPKDHEWMRVYLLQDSEKTAPYWFPRPCFHCDNPMCVSVCPVGATYKRSDGIVLVDNDRCIGCKFCMTGCPYSVRVFHWKKPPDDPSGGEYSPEKGYPAKEGTVGKCIFCPDKLRNGELPRCVSACPMGVIFFGDLIEDTVTNGTETFRFSELIRDRAGYRFLESLGTEPSVYYLPPVARQFPAETGLEEQSDSIRERFSKTPLFQSLNPQKPVK